MLKHRADVAATFNTEGYASLMLACFRAGRERTDRDKVESAIRVVGVDAQKVLGRLGTNVALESLRGCVGDERAHVGDERVAQA